MLYNVSWNALTMFHNCNILPKFLPFEFELMAKGSLSLLSCIHTINADEPGDEASLYAVTVAPQRRARADTQTARY